MLVNMMYPLSICSIRIFSCKALKTISYITSSFLLCQYLPMSINLNFPAWFQYKALFPTIMREKDGVKWMQTILITLIPQSHTSPEQDAFPFSLTCTLFCFIDNIFSHTHEQTEIICLDCCSIDYIKDLHIQTS